MITLKSLAKNISKDSGESAQCVERILKAAFDAIKEDVALDQEVRVHGFGTFKLKHRAARKGRNPQTGEELQIKASSIMVFKQSKAKVSEKSV